MNLLSLFPGARMKQGNLLITKHNDLIEASYKLSLEEQRLVLSCIAQIDSRLHKDVPDSITVSAEDYASLFGIKVRHAYEQMKGAVDRLYERDIRVKTPGQKDRLRWVYRVSYLEGEGKVSLRFSPDIKPYIGQLNGLFKSYKLKNISRLRSAYSIRMYELLNQWRDTGTRFILVKDFKYMLQLDDKYHRYSELNRCVIKPSLAEINAKTDMVVSLSTEKKGRSIYKLIFNFECKRSRNSLSLPHQPI